MKPPRDRPDAFGFPLEGDSGAVYYDAQGREITKEQWLRTVRYSAKAPRKSRRRTGAG